MTYTLLMMFPILLGLVLMSMGVLFIVVRKSRLAGFILLGIGALLTLIAAAAMAVLVIASRTMG